MEGGGGREGGGREGGREGILGNTEHYNDCVIVVFHITLSDQIEKSNTMHAQVQYFHISEKQAQNTKPYMIICYNTPLKPP